MRSPHALLVGLLLSLCFYRFVTNAEEALLAIGRADQKYFNRTDAESLNEAIRTYARIAKDSASYEAWWKLSRAYWYLANHSNEEEKAQKFKMGIEAAKKATEVDPNSCEGHFWLGVNYGMYAENSSKFTALTLIDDVKEALERAKEIDQNCECGGPDRVLGRVYAKVPWFKGGSKRKAVEYLQRSLQLCPQDTQSRIFLAEVYLEMEKEDLAVEQLTAVLKQKTDPQWIPETKENKILAEKLLDQIEQN